LCYDFVKNGALHNPNERRDGDDLTKYKARSISNRQRLKDMVSRWANKRRFVCEHVGASSPGYILSYYAIVWEHFHQIAYVCLCDQLDDNANWEEEECGLIVRVRVHCTVIKDYAAFVRSCVFIPMHPQFPSLYMLHIEILCAIAYMRLPVRLCACVCERCAHEPYIF
jgi:hypothetical protein